MDREVSTGGAPVLGEQGRGYSAHLVVITDAEMLSARNLIALVDAGFERRGQVASTVAPARG